MNQVNVHTQVDSGPVSEKKCPDLGYFISFVCVFADGTDDQSARSSLEKRCEHLQNQVWEMEVGFEGTFNAGSCGEGDGLRCLICVLQSFLKDYGLIWVGDVGGSHPGGGSGQLLCRFCKKRAIVCAKTG